MSKTGKNSGNRMHPFSTPSFRILLVAVFTAAHIGMSFGSADARQQDVTRLFEKMRNARTTVSYRGEFTIERPGAGKHKILRKRVVADPLKNVYREELILDPEQKERLERIRNNVQKTRFPRRRRQLMKQWNRNFQRIGRPPQFFPEQAFRLERLRKNYTFSITDGGFVAGRTTELLSIEPVYELRQVNRLWIDDETGLVLKREIFSADAPDEPVLRREFTEIEIEPEKKEGDVTVSGPVSKRSPENRMNRFTVSEYGSQKEIPEDILSRLGFPTYLPEGFELEKVRILRFRRREMYHQVYSDGLIMFSLFQSQGKPPEHVRLRPREGMYGGMFQPEGTILFAKQGDWNYTIMGFAPRELLQPVLDSITETRGKK